jgi:hypothetical protein
MPVALTITNQKRTALNALSGEAIQHLKLTVKPDQTETLQNYGE